MLKKLKTILILFSIVTVFSHPLNAMNDEKMNKVKISTPILLLSQQLNLVNKYTEQEQKKLVEAYADADFSGSVTRFYFACFVLENTIKYCGTKTNEPSSKISFLTSILEEMCTQDPNLPFETGKVKGNSHYYSTEAPISLMHYAFLEYNVMLKTYDDLETDKISHLVNLIQTLVNCWDKGEYSDKQKNYSPKLYIKIREDATLTGEMTADQLAQNLKIDNVFWKQPPRLDDRYWAALGISLKLSMYGAIPSMVTSVLTKTKSQKWLHIPAVGLSGFLIYKSIINYNKHVEHLYPNNSNPFKNKTLGLTLKSLTLSYGIPALLIEGGRYLKNSNFSAIKNKWRQHFKA